MYVTSYIQKRKKALAHFYHYRNMNSDVCTFSFRIRHRLIFMPDIVRILFMVPIYAWVSFASYLYWNHSTILILLRDGYESTVLTSFFYLLLLYIDPEPEGQKDIMRKEGLSWENDEEARRQGKSVKKWALPFGSIKRKPAVRTGFNQHNHTLTLCRMVCTSCS
jgi:hypothetical protein